MIQQVWIGETLPESWNEEVLCPLYKKGDKIDCRNYRCICLLNVAYKAFVKVLHSCILPYAILRQILEKNEFNITTNHLFIDVERAYYTITRNGINVIMV
jgi:hypothetical protein